MIFPSNRVRIVIATKPVDFRKGHDGLAALVKNELRKEPFTGTVFVFRSASVSLDAPLTSISSAGFTISPMFGATSSVRLLLVFGRFDSDKAFPLAGDSHKAKIKPVSEARFCVSIQTAHKPPDS